MSIDEGIRVTLAWTAVGSTHPLYVKIFWLCVLEVADSYPGKCVRWIVFNAEHEQM